MGANGNPVPCSWHSFHIVILSEAKDLLFWRCKKQQVLRFAQDDNLNLSSEFTGHDVTARQRTCASALAPCPDFPSTSHTRSEHARSFRILLLPPSQRALDGAVRARYRRRTSFRSCRKTRQHSDTRRTRLPAWCTSLPESTAGRPQCGRAA